MDENPIRAILIDLDIGGRLCLFIALDSKGGIHRLGTGEEGSPHEYLQVGNVGPEMFDCLVATITPQLLHWFRRGVARDPALKGTLCTLKLCLKRQDGTEMWSHWQYGTQSCGPPPEIRRFVIAAVDATGQWYETSRQNNSHKD